MIVRFLFVFIVFEKNIYRKKQHSNKTVIRA